MTNLLITNFLHYKATNQMEDLLLDANDEAIANNTIDIEMHENEIQDIKVAHQKIKTNTQDLLDLKAQFENLQDIRNFSLSMDLVDLASLE